MNIYEYLKNLDFKYFFGLYYESLIVLLHTFSYTEKKSEYVKNGFIF